MSCRFPFLHLSVGCIFSLLIKTAMYKIPNSSSTISMIHLSGSFFKMITFDWDWVFCANTTSIHIKHIYVHWPSLEYSIVFSFLISIYCIVLLYLLYTLLYLFYIAVLYVFIYCNKIQDFLITKSCIHGYCYFFVKHHITLPYIYSADAFIHRDLQ